MCKKCGKAKPLSDFYKNKSTVDGFNRYCKTCVNEYNKNAYSNFPQKFKKRNTIYRASHPIRVWAAQCLNNHKQFGIDINISVSELEKFASNNKICNICGKQLIWHGSKLKRWFADTPSLDRIDNESFISINNIQMLCLECNRTKGSKSMKDFIKYCLMVGEKFECV